MTPARDAGEMTAPKGGARRTTRTADMVTAALIAALISAAALVTIPVGAVPVTLQTFFVVLAALLLPPAWAAGSMGVYVLLGAVGVPVFSGGKAGLGVLAGPTGGYLIGFVAGAAAGAALRAVLRRRGVSALVSDGCAAALTVLLVYAFGVAQLAVVANLTLGQALVAGALPFAAIDIAKAVAAVAVAAAVRRARGV